MSYGELSVQNSYTNTNVGYFKRNVHVQRLKYTFDAQAILNKSLQHGVTPSLPPHSVIPCTQSLGTQAVEIPSARTLIAVRALGSPERFKQTPVWRWC